MHDAPLILTNLGHLPKIALMGDSAFDWLSQRNLEVPIDVFGARRTNDDGWIVRAGIGEWMIESGPNGGIVDALRRELANAVAGIYSSPREHATFILRGPRVYEVFAQTCALDLRKAGSDHLIYTSLAGAHCAILPESGTTDLAYRIWIDPSYAHYLWGTLAQIVRELGGEALFVDA